MNVYRHVIHAYDPYRSSRVPLHDPARFHHQDSVARTLRAAIAVHALGS